jgi:hypothetical protein
MDAVDGIQAVFKTNLDALPHGRSAVVASPPGRTIFSVMVEGAMKI